MKKNCLFHKGSTLGSCGYMPGQNVPKADNKGSV
jgi:hypothetical protein